MQHRYFHLSFAAGVAAFVLAAPAVATADSVAFVKGGNIWLATTDGARQFQVTSGGGYVGVAQADDGTLTASVASNAHLRKLDRLGNVLADFATPVSDHSPGLITFQGPFDIDVSPNGKTVGYGFYEYGLFSDPTTGHISSQTKNGHAFTHADSLTGFTDPGYKYSTSWDAPEFVDDSHVLISNGPNDPYVNPIAVEEVGTGEDKSWFTDATVQRPMEAAISRNKRVIGLVSGPERKQLSIYRDTDGVLGATPGQPLNIESCFTYSGAGLTGPTFNADGSRAFWESTDGIEAADFTMTNDCGAAQDSRVIIPGGTSADWGPADVPTSRPMPAAGPGPATGSSGAAGGSTSAGSGGSGVRSDRGSVLPAPVGGDDKPVLPATAAGQVNIVASPLRLSTLRRGRAAIAVTVGTAGTVKLRVFSGRTTVATGHARATGAGGVKVSLSRPTGAALKAIRGRGSVAVKATLDASGLMTTAQATLRVR